MAALTINLPQQLKRELFPLKYHAMTNQIILKYQYINAICDEYYHQHLRYRNHDLLLMEKQAFNNLKNPLANISLQCEQAEHDLITYLDDYYHIQLSVPMSLSFCYNLHLDDETIIDFNNLNQMFHTKSLFEPLIQSSLMYKIDVVSTLDLDDDNSNSSDEDSYYRQCTTIFKNSFKQFDIIKNKLQILIDKG